MSRGMTPAWSRHPAAEGRGDCAQGKTSNGTEARLRDLVELYRKTTEESSNRDADLGRLVEEDQARRLLAAWEDHVAALRAEIEAINAALEGTDVCLEAHAMEPGPGVSYLACLEVGIVGDRNVHRPSAFAALTRRAEARLQIRMPGSVRHETRYVALGEIFGETWKEWLLDLLEANRVWQRAPR